MKQLFFLLTLMGIASFSFSQGTQKKDSIVFSNEILKTMNPVKQNTVTIREVYMQKTDTLKVAITYATKSGTVKLTEGFIQRTAYYSNAIQNECHCNPTSQILLNKKKKLFKEKKIINVSPL